jgi:hypothetical protein
LLKERAVLLNEAKKHRQTLEEKTSSLQEQHENIIGEKDTRIEKVYKGRGVFSCFSLRGCKKIRRSFAIL